MRRSVAFFARERLWKSRGGILTSCGSDSRCVCKYLGFSMIAWWSGTLFLGLNEKICTGFLLFVNDYRGVEGNSSIVWFGFEVRLRVVGVPNVSHPKYWYPCDSKRWKGTIPRSSVRKGTASETRAWYHLLALETVQKTKDSLITWYPLQAVEWGKSHQDGTIC